MVCRNQTTVSRDNENWSTMNRDVQYFFSSSPKRICSAECGAFMLTTVCYQPKHANERRRVYRGPADAQLQVDVTRYDANAWFSASSGSCDSQHLGPAHAICCSTGRMGPSMQLRAADMPESRRIQHESVLAVHSRLLHRPR